MSFLGSTCSHLPPLPSPLGPALDLRRLTLADVLGIRRSSGGACTFHEPGKAGNGGGTCLNSTLIVLLLLLFVVMFCLLFSLYLKGKRKRLNSSSKHLRSSCREHRHAHARVPGVKALSIPSCRVAVFVGKDLSQLLQKTTRTEHSTASRRAQDRLKTLESKAMAVDLLHYLFHAPAPCAPSSSTSPSCSTCDLQSSSRSQMPTATRSQPHTRLESVDCYS